MPLVTNENLSAAEIKVFYLPKSISVPPMFSILKTVRYWRNVSEKYIKICDGPKSTGMCTAPQFAQKYYQNIE